MKLGSVPIFILAAHILSMLGFATFAALLPELRDLWRLSNFEAGVIGSMFFTGYIATVSYWTALTDRHDGRKVYLAGSLLAAAGSAGFGWLAEGFAGAVLCQGLLGAGIAATYMPGLRLLSERISGPGQSRYIAFYTSFFGIGTALSLALAGLIAPLAGWRTAFLLSALGPLLCGRARVRLGRAFAKTSSTREIFFLEDALSSRCLAPRDGQPRGRRLHARLRSALPRAVRLARLDGGISRLLLGLSRGCKLSVAACHHG